MKIIFHIVSSIRRHDSMYRLMASDFRQKAVDSDKHLKVRDRCHL